MKTLFKVDHVSVRIAETEILHDVSIELAEGLAICIVGKAGSGKSTLLKVISGLVLPDEGAVYYKGKNIHNMNKREALEFRAACSFAFQDAALWANQSIYNNLALPLAIHKPQLNKTETDAIVKRVIQRVGYVEGLGFRPSDLSMGEQKLISLARCLICEPEVLFLDEPTASLDHEAVERLTQVLLEEKKAGKTILMVTHDANLLVRIADQICVVANGSLATQGPAEKIAPLLGGDLVRKIRENKIEEISLDDPRR
jgi:phospholipid/cholesterol/gamma-HCH transport system ATP-binding protein